MSEISLNDSAVQSGSLIVLDIFPTPPAII